MTRLQKKCLVGSVLAHGSLVVLLLVLPGFSVRKNKTPELPILDVIPAKAIDEALFGGGQPNPAPPLPVIEPPPPEPEPEPPKIVQPVKPLVERKPDPPPAPEPAPEKVKTPAPEKTRPEVKKPPAEPRRQIQPNLKVTRRPTDRSTPKPNNTQARQKQLEERLQALRAFEEKWAKNSVTPVGPGGEAYANYRQIVMSVYNKAWIHPGDLTDDSATVEVTVTIKRDGTVVSDGILKRSGIPVLDRSVQRTLEAVRFVAPFPENAPDEQRTFKIQFNLKSKSLIG